MFLLKTLEAVALFRHGLEYTFLVKFWTALLEMLNVFLTQPLLEETLSTTLEINWMISPSYRKNVNYLTGKLVLCSLLTIFKNTGKLADREISLSNLLRLEDK